MLTSVKDCVALANRSSNDLNFLPLPDETLVSETII